MILIYIIYIYYLYILSFDLPLLQRLDNPALSATCPGRALLSTMALLCFATVAKFQCRLLSSWTNGFGRSVYVLVASPTVRSRSVFLPLSETPERLQSSSPSKLTLTLCVCVRVLVLVCVCELFDSHIQFDWAINSASDL